MATDGNVSGNKIQNYITDMKVHNESANLVRIMQKFQSC